MDYAHGQGHFMDEEAIEVSLNGEDVSIAATKNEDVFIIGRSMSGDSGSDVISDIERNLCGMLAKLEKQEKEDERALNIRGKKDSSYGVWSYSDSGPEVQGALKKTSSSAEVSVGTPRTERDGYTNYEDGSTSFAHNVDTKSTKERNSVTSKYTDGDDTIFSILRDEKVGIRDELLLGNDSTPSIQPQKYSASSGHDSSSSKRPTMNIHKSILASRKESGNEGGRKQSQTVENNLKIVRSSSTERSEIKKGSQHERKEYGERLNLHQHMYNARGKHDDSTVDSEDNSGLGYLKIFEEASYSSLSFVSTREQRRAKNLKMMKKNMCTTSRMEERKEFNHGKAQEIVGLVLKSLEGNSETENGNEVEDKNEKENKISLEDIDIPGVIDTEYMLQKEAIDFEHEVVHGKLNEREWLGSKNSNYLNPSDIKSAECSNASKETRAALAATLILKSGGSFGTAAQVIDSILNQSETETTQQQIVSKAAHAATTILAAGGSFDKTVNRMANILRESREGANNSKNDEINGKQDGLNRSPDGNGTQSNQDGLPSTMEKDLVIMGRSVDGRSADAPTVDGRSVDALSVDAQSIGGRFSASSREEKSSSNSKISNKKKISQCDDFVLAFRSFDGSIDEHDDESWMHQDGEKFGTTDSRWFKNNEFLDSLQARSRSPSTAGLVSNIAAILGTGGTDEVLADHFHHLIDGQPENKLVDVVSSILGDGYIADEDYSAAKSSDMSTLSASRISLKYNNDFTMLQSKESTEVAKINSTRMKIQNNKIGIDGTKIEKGINLTGCTPPTVGSTTQSMTTYSCLEKVTERNMDLQMSIELSIDAEHEKEGEESTDLNTNKGEENDSTKESNAIIMVTDNMEVPETEEDQRDEAESLHNIQNNAAVVDAEKEELQKNVDEVGKVKGSVENEASHQSRKKPVCRPPAVISVTHTKSGSNSPSSNRKSGQFDVRQPENIDLKQRNKNIEVRDFDTTEDALTSRETLNLTNVSKAGKKRMKGGNKKSRMSSVKKFASNMIFGKSRKTRKVTKDVLTD